MGFLLLLVLAFSLLPSSATPIRDAHQSSCSSISQDHVFRHLNSSGELQLILHHPRSPCSPALFPSSLPFSALLLHDDARARSLAARLNKPRQLQRRPPPSSPLLDHDTATLPVSSGASIGAGNYITRVGLGSPAQSLVVVVDTGSSLSWVQCFPCDYCHAQVGSLFDPFDSDTYHSVSCSSPECSDLQSATLNSPACSRLFDVCIYEASYGDGSYSIGYLSTDTLSLGSGGGATLQDFVYGCGEDNEGLFGQSDGLFGLARNNLSLFSQLAPTFGYSFSYCLPTPAGTGYLSFGRYNPAEYSYTPLVPSSLDNSLYFVQLSGINVEGKGLSLPSSAYISLPTIMDSGTVITRLPSKVYDGLSSAVVAALNGYSQASAYSILDTCFTGSVMGLPVPAVDLVFQGGATLRLPPNNVMIDVQDDTACLAFAPANSVTIIGNRQQQTFRVVYDVSRSRIGFGGTGCA